MDMDHKLRVAMDNLIRKVRVASSSRPPPGRSTQTEAGKRRGEEDESASVLCDLAIVYKI